MNENREQYDVETEAAIQRFNEAIRKSAELAQKASESFNEMMHR